MTSTHKWVAGAVVAALLLVAGSWALLISPQRAQASDLREQTVAQESANDTIRLRTQQLKAQFASLPQRRAELAEIQQQLPASPEPAALLRQLASVADDAGVSVDAITPGQPQPLAGATGAAGTPAGTPAGTSAATAGVQAIATTVVVKGGYAELTLFLQRLQSSMRRAYLVENLTLTPGEAAAGSTAEVPLTMTVTGKVFVLATAATGTTATGTATGTTAPGTTAPGTTAPGTGVTTTPAS